MKHTIELDITSLVKAIEKLQQEVRELRTALKDKVDSGNRLSYRKSGPKRNSKYLNTNYRVEILQLNFIVNLDNVESRRGKTARHVREYLSDYIEFPFVINVTFSIAFKENGKIIKTNSITLPRELMEDRKQCLDYLNSVYTNVIEEIKKIVIDSSVNGYNQYDLVNYDTKLILEKLDNKKIELNQL